MCLRKHMGGCRMVMSACNKTSSRLRALMVKCAHVSLLMHGCVGLHIACVQGGRAEGKRQDMHTDTDTRPETYRSKHVPGLLKYFLIFPWSSFLHSFRHEAYAYKQGANYLLSSQGQRRCQALPAVTCAFFVVCMEAHATQCIKDKKSVPRPFTNSC